MAEKKGSFEASESSRKEKTLQFSTGGLSLFILPEVIPVSPLLYKLGF